MAQLFNHGYRNVTSYSLQELFHACPRKFSISQRRNAQNTEQTNNVSFAFGHAVGAAVAEYDKAQDLRASIWAAFLAWDMDFATVEETNKANKKSLWQAIAALYAYELFHKQNKLADYEVIKVEARIGIDFEDGHFYTGHIDELLRHKETKQYLVKENKTTGLNNINPTIYANSDQALSYAIVIDMLDSSEIQYEVLYTVYSVQTSSWEIYPFVKQGHKKAEWIQDQLLLHQQLEGYQELNFFPKRGRSCFEYMRPCQYFDICDLSVKHKFTDLPAISSLSELGELDFVTTLSEILSRHSAQPAISTDC